MNFLAVSHAALFLWGVFFFWLVCFLNKTLLTEVVSRSQNSALVCGEPGQEGWCASPFCLMPPT